MPRQQATLALLANSPALASILAATLGEGGDRRVRTFDSLTELGSYMRIAPVDAIIADFDLADGNLADFSHELRYGALTLTAPLVILALTRVVSPQMQHRCAEAGIHEVIVKPMSPGYIAERVSAHLAHIPQRARGTQRAPAAPSVIDDWRTDPAHWPSNVVVLADRRGTQRNPSFQA